MKVEERDEIEKLIMDARKEVMEAHAKLHIAQSRLMATWTAEAEE